MPSVNSQASGRSAMRSRSVAHGHEKTPVGVWKMRRAVQSHWSDLNRRPLDYESSALPLSYSGNLRRICPGADSNRDAFRHHPLKMACLPVSPPGRFTTVSLLVGSLVRETELTASPR